MFESRSLFLTALVASLSLVRADSNSICYSYGVDYVDEGSYFINSTSLQQFTSVSTFEGCNPEVADVLFVSPINIEYLCSQIATTPADDPKLSTCPIQKNQISSGHWLLLILGNNGDDGQPFAWQRDLYITAGVPVTSTYTPTVTFSLTSTPIETQTTTTTFLYVSTVGPFSTTTLPSATASRAKTVTPKPVTATTTKIMTKTSVSITKVFAVVTSTTTATCTTPGRPTRPDKPAKYSPTRLHPAALVTPTTIPRMGRFVRKSDRAVDYEWARRRIEAAKQRRDAKAANERRAPDQPTYVVTAETPVNSTTTILASPITTVETVLVNATTTSTLPPATVFAGIVTNTITLPTPTKTQIKLGYATTTKVITLGGTFTRVKTVTPTSSVSACRRVGGHFDREK